MRPIYFLLATFLMLGFAGSHSLAEVYVGKNKTENSQDQQAAEQVKAKPKLYNKNKTTFSPQEMEAMADFSNEYYKGCVQQPHRILSGEKLELLCACMSAGINESLSLDEMRTLVAHTPEGQTQRQAMMTDIYVPCMETPVRDLLMQGCLADENVQSRLTNRSDVCDCMAQSLSDHVQAIAPAYIENAMQDNPDLESPLAQIFSSPSYFETAQTTLVACIQQYEVPAE